MSNNKYATKGITGIVKFSIDICQKQFESWCTFQTLCITFGQLLKNCIAAYYPLLLLLRSEHYISIKDLLIPFQGYLSRQALYSCLTCCPVEGAGGRAGVCLGCSLHCHSSHTLVELYTKRNFRCDCGNSKFVMATCKLAPVCLPLYLKWHGGGLHF